MGLSASMGYAGGKADKGKAVFSVHMETDAQDNPKMIFGAKVGGEDRYFRRVPDVSIKDVVSFNPFPADDGQTYGAVFYLKPHVARRFSALTNAAQGSWFITQVNGRVMDAMMIDKQIDDGMVVVWKGIFLQDINLLDKTLPRRGEEGKKRKKKKD